MREQFLAEIIENVADDAPRLVFADWLDENGEPERAELIRVQVEYAAHFDPHEHAPRDEALRRRERDLLFDHWPRWLHDAFDGLAHDVGTSARDDNDFGVSLYSAAKGELGHFDCSFRRGFVAEVTLTLDDFYGREGEGIGPRLARAAPLEEVRLSDRGPLEVDGWGFLWFREVAGLAPSGLPAALFKCLRRRRDPLSCNYATAAEAAAALSAACLTWAKANALAEVAP